MYSYSKTTGGFYLTAARSEYENKGSWPADAVGGISHSQRDELSAGESSGRKISADANGYPTLIDPPSPALEQTIAALVKQIDADADSIYTAALGNRATEYAQAEAEAQSYKDAGYAGEVPASVQAWATATDNTAQWAAESILAAAAAWRTTQAAIRANRLSNKESARTAVDFDAIDAVKAQWQTFVIAISVQLGLS